MARPTDPTEPIRKMAASMPTVEQGSSCNQSSYKAGKKAFLFIGPGAKGIGYKAMFKLDRSMPEARKLAAESPDRFEVGSTGWVTTRFSSEKPLPKKIWEKWLRESYDICSAVSASVKRVKKKSVMKSTAEKTKKKTKSKRRTAKR